MQHQLATLQAAELLAPQRLFPIPLYAFQHVLTQEVAYHSLLKSTRQHYHARIAQVLAGRFLETARIQPELLAHHYTEAGHHAQALGYWQRAGEHATQRSAHVASALGKLGSTPPNWRGN